MILEKNYDSCISEIDFHGSPEVIKIEKFDLDLVKKVERKVNRIHNIGQPIIPLSIDSSGGKLHALQSILETLSSSDKKVLTFVKGKAHSCGLILLGFGDIGYRIASPYSSGMIHEFTWGKRDKVSEAESVIEHARYQNDKIFKKLADHCNHDDEEYFLDLMYEQNKNADNWLRPEDLIDHNIVDKIGRAKMEFEVNTNFDIKIDDNW